MTRKEIILDGSALEYWLRVSTRAKRVSLVIEHDGKLVAVLPQNKRECAVEKFIKENKNWINRNRSKQENSNVQFLRLNKKLYIQHKKRAHAAIVERVQHFNTLYDFSFNRVSVRNQKTQWGSCSEKKNLQFNFRLIFLPPHLMDYIIVHELCHLAELNHSRSFWNLVAQTIPHYKECNKELHSYKL
jgi:predicted metal-dependent hydrolase